MRTRAAAVLGSGPGRLLAGVRSGLGRLLAGTVGVAAGGGAWWDGAWCDGEEHAPSAMTRTRSAALGRRIRCLPGGSIRHRQDSALGSLTRAAPATPR